MENQEPQSTIRTAVLVLPPLNILHETVIQEEDLSPTQTIAGLPIIKRALLSLRKGGISKIFILSKKPLSSLKEDLDKDPRLANHLSWLKLETDQFPLNFLKVDEPFLLLSLSVHFHWTLIKDLCSLDPGPFSYWVISSDIPSKKAIRVWVEDGKIKELCPSNPVHEAHALPILILPGKTLETQDLPFHENIKRQIQEGLMKGFWTKPDHICHLIEEPASIKRIEKILLKSVGGKMDGMVDRYLNRPISLILTKFFLKTSITPNAITLLSFFIGSLSAYFFSLGGYLNPIIGGLLFQFSSVVDCSDGEVARLKFMESSFGKWLDITLDNIAHLLIFSGITWAVVHHPQGYDFLAWGLLSLVGIIFSFIMVTLSLQISSPREKGPEVRTYNRMQGIISMMANRDFSIVILIFAFWAKLPWLLILVGCGSNLFAFILLSFYLKLQRQKNAVYGISQAE